MNAVSAVFGSWTEAAHVQPVQQDAGLDVRVISGPEEARLLSFSQFHGFLTVS
jgi:hypothetical protein